MSPGYFEAISARATAGRLFTSQDVAGGAPAVIVNETFVKRYLDTAAPVGRRVDFAWDTHGMQTIVGVLNDVREGALNDDAHPAIYIPLAQRPSSWMYLVVRTAADPATVLPSIRTAVLGIDPQLPLANIRQLRRSSTTAPPRSASRCRCWDIRGNSDAPRRPGSLWCDQLRGAAAHARVRCSDGARRITR